MIRRVMSLASCCAALACPAVERGAPLPVMGEPVKESGWTGFSLLPKAFQRNPQLEMTVVSHVTEHGRSLPQPDTERPAYYVAHNSGYTTRGEFMGDHPPEADYLSGVLQRALEQNGYRPATAEHPPTLALIFHWGSHNQMDPEMRRIFPELARRHVRERSLLVGGRAFETSIARRMAYGDFLTDHTAKNDFLTDQASMGLYFAVVSAYDLAALRAKQRRLVWRASLTVNSNGVSMVDSLPALILSAAPVFGREMKSPEIVLRRVRRGVVEYGEPSVVESDVPLSSPGKSD